MAATLLPILVIAIVTAGLALAALTRYVMEPDRSSVRPDLSEASKAWGTTCAVAVPVTVVSLLVFLALDSRIALGFSSSLAFGAMAGCGIALVLWDKTKNFHGKFFINACGVVGGIFAPLGLLLAFFDRAETSDAAMLFRAFLVIFWAFVPPTFFLMNYHIFRNINRLYGLDETSQTELGSTLSIADYSKYYESTGYRDYKEWEDRAKAFWAAVAALLIGLSSIGVIRKPEAKPADGGDTATQSRAHRGGQAEK